MTLKSCSLEWENSSAVDKKITHLFNCASFCLWSAGQDNSSGLPLLKIMCKLNNILNYGDSMFIL